MKGWTTQQQVLYLWMSYVHKQEHTVYRSSHMLCGYDIFQCIPRLWCRYIFILDECKWVYKKLGSEDLYWTAELDLGNKFGTSISSTKSHKKILKVLDKISIFLKHEYNITSRNMWCFFCFKHSSDSVVK